MSITRTLDAYRWPIFLASLLVMTMGASAVIVYVATRPDSPRPIPGYYEAARKWDVDEAVADASRQLGWTVHYEFPADVPHYPGMPRPIDVMVATREGQPVTGLSGHLFAIRPSDTRLNASAELFAEPRQPGRYRALIRMDMPGNWDVRIDTKQQALRFVDAARLAVLPDAPPAEGAAR